MPRIKAASIPEHVAQQEAAVIAAAAGLFADRGVAAVSLADIADAVGLARTSLYRYFPSKSHIVQAWFEREMPTLVAGGREVADDTSAPPRDRLRRWLFVQVRFLFDPAHDAMIRAALETDDLPASVRTAVQARHAELYETLEPIIRDLAGRRVSRAVVDIRVMLVAGLVRSAGDLARAGKAHATIERELLRAATAVASGNGAHDVVVPDGPRGGSGSEREAGASSEV